jgi:hypothetical protein
MPRLLPTTPSNRDLTGASTLASAVRNSLSRQNAESLYVESVETVSPTVAGVRGLFERDVNERVKGEVQIGWNFLEVADVNVERPFGPRPRSVRRGRAAALASVTRHRLDRLDVEQGTHGWRFWGGSDGDL